MMSSRKNLLKLASLALLVGFALALIGAWKTTPVQALDDDDGKAQQRPVNVALGSTSLVPGESMRTIFTNRGSEPISVLPYALNADGVVVKQAPEPLVIGPGRMRAFEITREEMGGGEGSQPGHAASTSALVRTEVTIRRADARSVLATCEVMDISSGRVRFQVVIAIIAILIG